jgi:ABC-type sugar transport system substrate-binding protein
MDGETCLVVGVDASSESLAAVESVVVAAGCESSPQVIAAAATAAAARALNAGYTDVDVEVVREDRVPADVITRIAADQCAPTICSWLRGWQPGHPRTRGDRP